MKTKGDREIEGNREKQAVRDSDNQRERVDREKKYQPRERVCVCERV